MLIIHDKRIQNCEMVMLNDILYVEWENEENSKLAVAELHDLQKDSVENKNIPSLPKFAEVVKRKAQRLKFKWEEKFPKSEVSIE